MPANTTPIFTLVPEASSCTIAAANSARDGSGTLVDLLTSGANGSRIDFIVFTSAQATPATSSARVQRVFLTDTAGLNPRLISEIAMGAATPSATAIGATATITFINGLIINAGQILKVAQSVYGSVADGTHAFARGGDF